MTLSLSIISILNGKKQLRENVDLQVYSPNLFKKSKNCETCTSAFQVLSPLEYRGRRISAEFGKTSAYLQNLSILHIKIISLLMSTQKYLCHFFKTEKYVGLFYLNIWPIFRILFLHLFQ